MNRILCSAGISLVFSALAFAQHALVGTYSGSFFFENFASSVNRPVGLKLEILTVEGDIVKGKVWRGGAGPAAPCAGDYPVEGNLKGDTLVLRGTQMSGLAKDCGMALRLKVDGNRLVGTMNKLEAQLSR
jgi:hypothetical protein